MNQRAPFLAAMLSAASVAVLGSRAESGPDAGPGGQPLPSLGDAGATMLDDALQRRRSVRPTKSSTRGLTPRETGRILWAAQGITDAASGGRTAPSAGALYPLEAYLVSPAGVFRYVPIGHALTRVASDDRRDALASAAHGQEAVRAASANIVLTGSVGKTAPRYGLRAERYVLLEAGHAAQNVLLEAVALGLDAVPIGAFVDADVARVIDARPGETPLYVLAIAAKTR